MSSPHLHNTSVLSSSNTKRLSRRLTLLHEYGVFNPTHQSSFDRLTRLAADFFEAPIAAISFTGDRYEWIQSGIGIKQQLVDREVSLSHHALEAKRAVVVKDRASDKRLLNNPLLADASKEIRYCAAVPLTTSNGLCLGALWIADTKDKREFNQNEARVLRSIAELAVETLERQRELAQGLQAEKYALQQAHILDQIAQRRALPDILRDLILEIEKVQPSMIGSVQLHNQAEGRLRHVAAPRLPRAYTEAIDGIAVGPCVGSCGTATYMGETVIAEDITTDPRWQDYRHLALRHNLRACWSTPITGAGGQVLGTFAMYYHTPKRPSEADYALIGEARSLAQIALQQHRDARALRRAQDKAEEMKQLKSAILANMSHEIRTPLTAILGFAEVLAGMVKGEACELLQMIKESGRRLQKTLLSILDLVALEGGTERLRLEKVDVLSVAEEVLLSIKPEADEKDLSLELDCPERPAPERPAVALADEAALARVLNHLISNAVKFTAKGGVSVRVLPGEEEVLVKVEDTGVGIAPSFMPSLYDEFTQESAGNSRDYQGVGLGLTIAQRLVKHMQGEIEVESKKGVGTTFFVRLPAFGVGNK